MSHHRVAGQLLLLLALLLATVAGSLLVGSTHIPVHRIPELVLGSEPSLDRTVLLDLRLPRILMAILVGGGLAGAGAAYQGLLLNPLADPFVIGASSGAALGATLAILVGWDRAVGIAALPLSAFVCSLVAVGMVYLLAGSGSSLSLILAGAAVSTIVSSLVSLLMILNDQSLGVIFNWLLGGLTNASWREISYGAPLIVMGVIALWLLSRPLDALSLGEEMATSLGLSAAGFRLAIVVAATVITAAAVAMAGIIGFVGLLAPHAARFLVGSRNSRLLPASCLIGALLLLLADDAARSLIPPQEVPASIITGLVGGIFFLFLLRRTMKGEEFQ